jgi:hypothetical protein
MEEHQPSPYAPPVNRISGGSVTVLKSSFQDTGAGSGVQVDTFVDIDDMAIVGDQGTGSFSVDAHGDGRGKAGIVRLGPAPSFSAMTMGCTAKWARSTRTTYRFRNGE